MRKNSHEFCYDMLSAHQPEAPARECVVPPSLALRVGVDTLLPAVRNDTTFAEPTEPGRARSIAAVALS